MAQQVTAELLARWSAAYCLSHLSRKLDLTTFQLCAIDLETGSGSELETTDCGRVGNREFVSLSMTEQTHGRTATVVSSRPSSAP